MAPPPRAKCQICNSAQSKYTCSTCMVLYCSVACYKQHRETSCSGRTAPPPSQSGSSDLAAISPEGVASHANDHTQGGPSTTTDLASNQDEVLGITGPKASGSELPPLDASQPLRPLTSLKWPYIPDQSSYPDPLKRDDPKPLNLAQYEAIATSPAIRSVLAAHTRLPGLLRALDQLRGPEREEELQRVLGVRAPDGGSTRGRGRGGYGGGRGGTRGDIDEDDMRALKELAGAVEKAVRGEKGDLLGLDWEAE